MDESLSRLCPGRGEADKGQLHAEAIFGHKPCRYSDDTRRHGVFLRKEGGICWPKHIQK
jgi:hypothetical protein